MSNIYLYLLLWPRLASTHARKNNARLSSGPVRTIHHMLCFLSPPAPTEIIITLRYCYELFAQCLRSIAAERKKYRYIYICNKSGQSFEGFMMIAPAVADDQHMMGGMDE